MTNQPPIVAGSEPGRFLRQTKAGLNPGFSTSTTWTSVIFMLPSPFLTLVYNFFITPRAPGVPAGETRKNLFGNTIRNSISRHSICATGPVGKFLQTPETKWGIP